MMDADQEREWLTVAEAAERMDVTEDEIIRLARSRVLRSRNLFGIPEVEPAIVPGVRHNPHGTEYPPRRRPPFRRPPIEQTT